MNRKTMLSYFILFLTALIWGTTFVAQKNGMNFIGPMYFTAIRFFLGSLILLPLVLFKKLFTKQSFFSALKSAIPAGILLWLGVGFQQIGIVQTTAGNAGFITGLYIVFVPILGMFIGNKTSVFSWLAVFIALIGLFLLSVSKDFRIQAGDGFVLLSAVFWACHLLFISVIAMKHEPLALACLQYVICAVLSLVAALIFENINAPSLQGSLPSLFYGGIASVGIAYTLQIYGQRHSNPTVAAIIFSFEGVFAALSGYIVLAEILSPRQVFGALFILFAVITSIIAEQSNSKKRTYLKTILN